MNQDTPRLHASLTNPANDSPSSNADNASNDKPSALKAEDHVKHPSHTPAASPRTSSDSSSRPQRRRNKPSLSCETCTVSRSAEWLFFLLLSPLPSLPFVETRIRKGWRGKSRPIFHPDAHQFQVKKTKVGRRILPSFNLDLPFFCFRAHLSPSVTEEDQCI